MEVSAGCSRGPSALTLLCLAASCWSAAPGKEHGATAAISEEAGGGLPGVRYPRTPTLTVTTEPPGATVRLAHGGGRVLGVTPLEIRVYPPEAVLEPTPGSPPWIQVFFGSATLRLDLAGYVASERTLRLDPAGADSALNVKLDRAAPK